jgi:hypothetical protein
VQQVLDDDGCRRPQHPDNHTENQDSGPVRKVLFDEPPALGQYI